MRKQHSKPFAEVLRDVRSVPQPTELVPRTVGVVFDDVLTDYDGRQFEEVEASVSLTQARHLVEVVDKVVLEDCGCGGFCGFAPLSKEQITACVATWRSGRHKRKQSPWPVISQWRAGDGATLLMISDPAGLK